MQGARRHRLASAPIRLDLFSGGTFTRASDGTYQTDADSIATAASNVRRIENRGDGLGDMLLLEGAGSNQAIYTVEWNSWGGEGGSSLATTTEIGPDGTDTTVRDVTFGANVIARVYRVMGGLAPADGATCVVSVWARVASGTAQFRLGLRQKDGVTHVYGSPHTVTTSWQRFDSAVSVGTGVAMPRVIIASDGSGSSYNVLCYGPQAENAVYWPSSYIPNPIGNTTARSGDVLSYAVGEYPDVLTTAGGRLTVALPCTSAEFVSAGGTYRILWLAGVAASGIQFVPQTGSNIAVRLYNNNASLISRVITLDERDQLLTLEWGVGASSSLAVSGATTGDGTGTGAATPLWSTETGIQIGANSTFARFGRYIEAL